MKNSTGKHGTIYLFGCVILVSLTVFLPLNLSISLVFVFVLLFGGLQLRRSMLNTHFRNRSTKDKRRWIIYSILYRRHLRNRALNTEKSLASGSIQQQALNVTWEHSHDNAQVKSKPADSEARRRLGWILGVASIILMVLSGWGFRWEIGQLWVLPNEGINFMLLGAVALGVSTWLIKPTSSPLFQVTKDPIIAGAIRWTYTLVGIASLLLFAETNGRWFLKDLVISQHIQVVLFGGGSLLVAYGLGGFNGIISLRTKLSSLLPLGLIVLVGFILRVWQLAEAVHIMVDELHFYDGVVHLWNSPMLPLLEPLDGIATFPHTFSYIERWTVALFGADFFGMRFTSSLFGTLTIIAIYLLGRAIADHKLGLIAAALLAVFPPHIHFSRLALNNIADPLFGTFAIAFLVSALRYNRQRDYVLAGMMLAFSSYFYEGGRLLFSVLFSGWLIFTLIRWRPWHHRRGLVIMGMTAALILLPYYYTSFVQSNNLAPRLTDQGRAGYILRDLREKPFQEVFLAHYEDALRPAVFHTIYSPDSSRFYYGGNTGVLLWYLVPFYLLGLFYALFRIRGIGGLLWAWVVFSLLGISLVVSTDWTVRFNVLFPVMMIAVAVGLRYPLEMLWPKWIHLRWLNIILVFCVVGMGIAEVNYYFGEHLTVYNQQFRENRFDFYDAFDRAQEVGGITTLIYITHNDVFNPVLDTSRVFRNIEMGYEIWLPSDSLIESLSALRRDQSYAFAIEPEDTETLDTIQSVLPVYLGGWSTYQSVPREAQYALYIYRP